MYSLASLSGINPLPAMHSLLVTLDVRNKEWFRQDYFNWEKDRPTEGLAGSAILKSTKWKQRERKINKARKSNRWRKRRVIETKVNTIEKMTYKKNHEDETRTV